jgi:hypothetical protein
MIALPKQIAQALKARGITVNGVTSGDVGITISEHYSFYGRANRDGSLRFWFDRRGSRFYWEARSRRRSLRSYTAEVEELVKEFSTYNGGQIPPGFRTEKS